MENSIDREVEIHRNKIIRDVVTPETEPVFVDAKQCSNSGFKPFSDEH